ncbi:MAG: caspase family protein [Chitinophagaceae bacterium]
MRKLFLVLLLIATNMLWAQQPKLMLPIGHANQVMSSNFSPDGKKVVTSSMDITAKIWDAQSGSLLADLKGHNGWVYSANYSPDGKNIVTASRDNTAMIWNALTGTLIKILKGHTFYVYNAIYSPNGKMIVTVSLDGTAKLWDAKTGSQLLSVVVGSMVTNASFSHDNKKFVTSSLDSGISVWNASNGALLAQMRGHTGKVYTANFSPDDKKIVSASRDGTAKLWNAGNGSLVASMERHTTGISSAIFSPDGKKIVTASGDKTAIIWDGNTGVFLAELKGHSQGVFSAFFSHDSKKIATTSFDKTAKIWSAEDGHLLVDLPGHTNAVFYSNFSPDDKKIITASADGTAKIWNSNGQLIADLAGHTSEIYGAGYSPDGKKIVTASNFSDVLIWDAPTGGIIQPLKGHTLPVYSAHFSHDGKRILTASWDSTAKIWNAANGELLVELKGHSSALNGANFSSDGRIVVTASFDGTAKIWDSIDGEELATIEEPDLATLTPELLHGEQEEVYDANFSPDGNTVVTASKWPVAPIWEAESGELINYYPGHFKAIHSACFSPDGTKILTGSKDFSAKIFDVTSRKVLLEVNHLDNVSDANFSPDGNKFVTGSWDHTAKVWDSQKGILLADLVGHNSNVCGAEFSPDGKRIITCSYDQTIKIWDAATGRLIYTFLAIDNSENFLQTASGYYFTTTNAAKLLHYVTADLKVITFEQLDVKYNRPDKVLEAIGNTDTALIQSYRKAYYKRIKKLSIDTTAFREGYSVPEADFMNRRSIEYEQKNGTLTLKIKGIDSTYKLDRYNLWINEVPVYGQRGISIRKRNRNNFDTTIIINLSQGENRIETSITNVNGTESYRIPLLVNYTPAVKQKEMIRFIGIGIDHFADNKYNLQYSAKDIRDLSIKLKEKYGNTIIIDTLFNENVTIGKVKALKDNLKKTTVNDKVIIAYSGHGMLSKDYDYYLSTYAVNFEKPEQNGLPYEELENLLDSIPARKKLMLIDACHSGEVDKEDLVTLNASPDSLIKGFKPVAYKQEGHLGLKNSFELMQSLFVNVGKSTGATIISAAAGTQFALERNDLKNGVFTYSILEAMNKYPTLKISQLKKIVGKRVEELTKGLQKPTSRNETIAVDWNIW